MSETFFTKGEWWVNPVGVHYNNTDIASYEICWSKDAECVVDHVYELADAHLIAAAPEMYGVISKMLEQFDTEEICRDIYDYAVISEAKKILAKARGEQ